MRSLIDLQGTGTGYRYRYRMRSLIDLQGTGTGYRYRYRMRSLIDLETRRVLGFGCVPGLGLGLYLWMGWG